MTTKRLFRGAAGPLPALLLPLLTALPAFAEDAPAKIDTGDTAWMLTSTALVLMMTIPGLALFYAGMVRKKNILATMMQSFIITCLVTVIWMIAGYSLAFTNGNAYIGDLSRLFLKGLGETWDKPFLLGAGTENSTQQTVPESVFMMFQLTFAAITCALIIGGYVSLANAGARVDPFVAGVDDRLEVAIGEDFLGQITAGADNPGEDRHATLC